MTVFYPLPMGCETVVPRQFGRFAWQNVLDVLHVLDAISNKPPRADNERLSILPFNQHSTQLDLAQLGSIQLHET